MFLRAFRYVKAGLKRLSNAMKVGVVGVACTHC